MKQAKVLTEGELKRVLATIQDMANAPRNRVAMMLSHFAGLRVGEIASLRMCDVLTPYGDIKEQVLLRSSVTKSGEARTIFVGDKLRRELEIYLATWESLVPDETPFLKSQRGKIFSPNCLCQLFRTIYTKAGIDGASSHSGRRWFITRLAQSNVSMKVIMTLAGHKHLSTTQRYIDVNDEMMRQAIRLL